MGNCLQSVIGSVYIFYSKVSNKVKSAWMNEGQGSMENNPNQFYPAIYDEEPGSFFL